MSETKNKVRSISVVKVKDREIPIDERLLKVLRKYVYTQMTLEELAKEIGLNGWEEAYEFVKNAPAWLMWTPFTLWEVTE
ncbi:hypothetical protein IOK49_02115 [Fervidicoccus fontis]|uniref:Uncharacterized protein n=2 Tax=Fervidicoccus fontis TaxID=683846 RepID=H9ZZG6_FERFK|nr:hypothetical protein [Fervidicoccus fontis]AFH42123.1 hypothetical protein FFONT_0131 [Fervidicoccus fontis Kam940]MBE9390877.1 hypothetical protein [Fervidicoccus fontis]PMB78040.1 MAG: RNA polymerase sigma factor SigX [Fervidicoccus fontis]HEW64463.1 hypothetical protein [Fervidicoccus fontis]